MNLINLRWRLKERKNFNTSRERKTRICLFLCAVNSNHVNSKVNSNHGIRLKTRMSFFIWPSLFSCNTKVNLNYCVGDKEKWPRKSYRNQDTKAFARRCSVKKVFLEISQNSQENTCARVFFLNRVLGLRPAVYWC